MLIGISNMIETNIAKNFIPEYVFITLTIIFYDATPQPSIINRQNNPVKYSQT